MQPFDHEALIFLKEYGIMTVDLGGDRMNLLFQNKKKNRIALCFTIFYIVLILFNASLRYAVTLIPLIVPVSFLALLLTASWEYPLKRWLFPVALAIHFVYSIRSIRVSYISLKMAEPVDDGYVAILAVYCLMLIAVALMFFGALLDFKRFKLLRYGSLGYEVLTLAELTTTVVIALSMSLTVSLVPSLELLPRALFYIGIFLLTI